MKGKLKYGMHEYADGGKVDLYEKPKLKKPPLPKVKDPIKKGSPGGPHTPGAKGTYPKRKKMACGGKVRK